MLKIPSILRHTILFFLSMIIIASCGDEIAPPVDNGDLTSIAYNPAAYQLNQPSYYPQMDIPVDNPLTVEGVKLGRFLFYDPILSADSTMSCASCHKPELSFTDGGATSKGIDGVFGTRSSMSLINIGYTKGSFFWDGRSNSLEDQASRPVVDPVELHNDWGNVEVKLKKHKNYPTMFRKAFGIDNKSEITQDLATKAIAQFERILISADSKYDKYKRGEVFLNDEEYIGFSLYFDVFGDGIPDGQCNHCHHLELAAGDGFFNNGLQEATLLQDFKDLGKGKITGNISENGKFRAPTLRNIMLTAPYMHDGSLTTIDQVLAHYVSGGKKSPNRDPLLVDKQLAELDAYYISCLKAFLQTLTDTTSLKNPEFTNPH